MPVFDFSAAPEDSRQPECTYTTFQSNEETATPEKPIMILDNTKRQWQHHSCGMFTNPILSGIGHTRDVSVVDMVAYQSLKTPTAVAAFPWVAP